MHDNKSNMIETISMDHTHLELEARRMRAAYLAELARAGLDWLRGRAGQSPVSAPDGQAA
jgi:hypothetical protein